MPLLSITQAMALEELTTFFRTWSAVLKLSRSSTRGTATGSQALKSERVADAERMQRVLDAHRERLAKRLEGRLTATGVPSPLAELNAARADDAERLREQIREVLEAHTGPKLLKAKAVVQALAQRGIECHVSMRTVQDHMKSIRREQSQKTRAA